MARTKTNAQNDAHKIVQHHDATDIQKNNYGQ